MGPIETKLRADHTPDPEECVGPGTSCPVSSLVTP